MYCVRENGTRHLKKLFIYDRDNSIFVVVEYVQSGFCFHVVMLQTSICLDKFNLLYALFVLIKSNKIAGQSTKHSSYSFCAITQKNIDQSEGKRKSE